MVSTATPWCLNYIFNEDALVVPLKILYADYGCTVIKKVIKLNNWCLNNYIIELIGRDGRTVTSVLKLNHAKGIDYNGLQHIRGMKNLFVLSIRGLLEISPDVSYVTLIFNTCFKY